MKKITHSLVAMFALIATTAFAAEPIAVWNGDFNESEKGGLTLNLNGNTCSADNSYIEITGNNGVMVSGGNVNHSTVLIKYSNLDWSNAGSGKVISLLTHKCGAKTEANCSGIAVASNGALHGIWINNKWSNTTGGPLVAPSDASAKVSLACTFVSALAADDEGTRAFYKDEDGIATQVYNASGLKGTKDNTVTTDWSIGGHYGTSTGSNVKTSATGMKIYGIAIFDKWLTQSEIEEYEFPSSDVETIVLTNDDGSGSLGGVGSYRPDALLIPDSSGIEAGKIVKVKSVTFVLDSSSAASADSISINGVQSSSKTISGTWPNTSYPLVTYNYGDGVDIEIGKSAPMVASGDSRWRLFANVTDADRQYIGMTNTTDMNKGYRPAYKIVLEVPIGDVKNPSKAEIEDDSIWENLGWDVVPTASDKAELTVSANAKLTIDNNTAFKSLKLIGQRNLTIAGITSSNIALISKINSSSFTGKLTFEIDASSGLTADTALKNFIKSASSKVNFVFTGSGSNGATLTFSTDNDFNVTLNTHIVFDGGTHTMTIRSESAGLKFGANATEDNPTIRITNNATLTFAARNLCGWTSGNADANGIIRVDNGSKLNLNPTGGTLYWAQQFYLEPGAQLTYSDGANFRINGGTNYAPQIFVPDSDTDMTATPAKIIRSGNNDFCVNGQGTKGMAISVGANSKLVIEGGIALNNTNCDVVKSGNGILEVTGNIVNQNFIVNAGSASLRGSITKLTFNQTGALNLDNGAPTITGSLVTATEKQLKLTIASPTHMMPVITLPAAADKTGWTAYVNGRAKENELIAEGNTLKLKWKIPPTIEVDIDDITIESTSDWNGGTVKIDVSGLKKGDYEGENDITYRLRFGDKTVLGSVANNIATFELDDNFTAGKIYRGQFELGYGEGETLVVAPITVYEGKLDYQDDVPWVNETPTTLGETGEYAPSEDVSIDGDVIKIDTQDQVTFTPTPDPDYVDKCDSEFTINISALEAVDDDLTVDEDAQAGVMIISDENGGVEFRFIGCDEKGVWQWMQGPAAELNTDYEVTISFHYAKDANDSDSVTYTIEGFTDSYTYAHRPNTADKVKEIIFADGTRFKSLVGTCQIEKADPVAQGIKPGEKQEIVADNDEAAQEKADNIPVMIPEDEAVIAALDTDEKKNTYKALFKVIAVKKNGSYTAEVVFADDKISTIKDDEKNILTEVVEALGSLVGEEGTLENIKGRPGLYYGIATDGELVNMGEATPDEWVIANKDGNIVGLKVKKTASAKQGFYKVICTPTKPTK